MIVLGCVVAVTLTLAAIAHVLWHLPVRRQMALEDWLVRGGLLLLMVTDAVWVLCLVFDVATARKLWIIMPSLLVASSAILGGFLILLWKYRRHKGTAALQPNVGTPPEGD